MANIRRAFVSTYDPSGLGVLRSLCEYNWRLVSDRASGATLDTLGLPYVRLSDYSGATVLSPDLELLDERLWADIFGDRDIYYQSPIDLVVMNLVRPPASQDAQPEFHPGTALGLHLIRKAAIHPRVMVVTDPALLPEVVAALLDDESLPKMLLAEMNSKALRHAFVVESQLVGNPQILFERQAA